MKRTGHKHQSLLNGRAFLSIAAGMLVGAGFAHNFNLASSVTGPSPYGPAAVIAGIIVCMVLGLTMREKAVA